MTTAGTATTPIPPVPPVYDCRVEPGHVLVREGSVDPRAFVVLEGRALMYVDGDPIVSFGPGCTIGELGLLDHSPRTATVRAETPMWVLVVGPMAYAALLQHPAVVGRLAEQLARQLRPPLPEGQR